MYKQIILICRHYQGCNQPNETTWKIYQTEYYFHQLHQAHFPLNHGLPQIGQEYIFLISSK